MSFSNTARWVSLSVAALLTCGAPVARARELPPVPYKPAAIEKWSPAQVREILDKTQTTRLTPDLGHLSAGEKAAVGKLLQVGQIFQDVYELQRHREASQMRFDLARRTDPFGKELATLYRLNQGPIAVTLDNRRVPFLAVDAPPPGKNVYPWDLTKAELDAYLKAHPDQAASLGDLRSVVRRADKASLDSDLGKLAQYPVLDTLHPGLKARLTKLTANRDRTVLYAAPYSVAYADQMIRAHRLLNEAADAMEADDWAFAKYLRNRARDLLSDDYESGDAAWLKGSFKNLNAQIGSYEVYDDELMGVRAFYSFSLLAARNAEGAALRKALSDVQSLDDSLPSAQHKKVQQDIPVGVYDVIADFGQARGGNTATNLPNEAYLNARYGSIILLRTNIMRDPNIFQGSGDSFTAAVAPAQTRDLTIDANFYRTLWHELGHYLGPDLTHDGRDFNTALGADASLLEEMKADLVALYLAPELQKRGYYTADQVKALYASGVLRVLQNNRPRRDQPYNMMQLMQWNWFLDRGVLKFDSASGKMTIDYARYPDAVRDLLKAVFALQENGDRAADDAFITKWGGWDEALHGRIATAIRGQQKYRYRLFEYDAIDK